MNTEQQTRSQELAKELKKKKIRKCVLIALAVCLVFYGISRITIESADSKLPDGQNNLTVGAEIDDETGSEDGEDADSEDEVNDESSKSDNKSDSTQKSENTQKSDSVQKSDKKDNSGKSDFAGKKDDKKPTPEDAAVDNSDDFTASNDGNVALKPETPQPVTVTLEIRCDTISNNMDYLENKSIKDYIPKDGVILAKTEYTGTTDNTVFDALNVLCRNNDIQMEFSYTPLYESNYVEGIGYLYEFDGGPASGWMYKVNDWFPNYGCSSYYLSDGDVIVWCYTCRGYGADVGDTSMLG